MNIDAIRELARLYVEEEQLEVPPLLFIEAADGSSPVFNLNSLPKDLWTAFIKLALDETQARQYVFLTESWMAHLQNNDPRSLLINSGKMQVTDLPLDDRSEIILLVQVWRRGKVTVWKNRIRYVGRDMRRLGVWELIPAPYQSRFLITIW